MVLAPGKMEKCFQEVIYIYIHMHADYIHCVYFQVFPLLMDFFGVP